jgi:hypothetical protein
MPKALGTSIRQSMIFKYGLTHITHLVVFFSFESNLGIANVILALNQTNLQTGWLGIVSRASIVIHCPLQKCLQGLKNSNDQLTIVQRRSKCKVELQGHSLIMSRVAVIVFLLLPRRQKHFIESPLFISFGINSRPFTS